MRQTTTESKQQLEYRKNWTVEGFVGTMLVVPVLVAFMAAPALMAGAVAGVVGLETSERLYHRVARVVRQRRPATSQAGQRERRVASGN